MADKINAAGYETKPWWPYVRELMEGGGSVTVEQLNVTENGTYTAEAGKAYSPVVVNVPAVTSDFSTATITSTNVGTISKGPFLTEEQGIEYIETQKSINAGDSLECVLYKGNAVLFMSSLTPVVSFTGSATALQEGEIYLVTGDCEFTFGDIS